MAEHHCANCGNPDVVRLATCHIQEMDEVQPGDPVGFVHCPDCHHDTPWHLSHRQNHLICSNRADRKTKPE
jgi:predicted RNA-binding Zn-ribbon protein involved in translation (DUF1610 family)